MVYRDQAGELLLAQLMDELTPLCTNREQLQTILGMVLAQYEIRHSRPSYGHPDLEQKIELFLSAKRLEGLSELTLDGYRLELQIFARYVSKPVNEIITSDIRLYLGNFPNLKQSSIAKKVSVLKSFFGWLVEEEILERDPMRKVKTPKTLKGLPKALTIEELEMLREACATPRQRALIEVLYATGARLAEIQKLNISDINWQAQSARVIGKGSKEREVYFSFKAAYHLRKYLMGRLDDCPALIVTDRRPYRRLSRRGIQREIANIAARSGVKKKVHPHVLRHTFATLTLNNGADLATIQSILGHSSPATTQIYAQVTDERKRQQYKRCLVQ